tara:strand:- start:1285 stop:1482 length:198 start_codon:yes stop_codon:yes gene_type:complete
MIDTINRVSFHPGMKQVLKMLGFDHGQCRLPHKPLTSPQVAELREALEAIGFFEWRLATDPSREL